MGLFFQALIEISNELVCEANGEITKREREREYATEHMRALFIKAVIDNEIQHAVIERKPISFLSLVSIYCHTYVKRTNASGTFWLWNARLTCEHCNFGICIQIEIYSYLLDLLGIKEKRKGRERKRKCERRATKLSFAALSSSKWFSTNLRTDVQTCPTWQHISNVLANVMSSIRLYLRRRLRTTADWLLSTIRNLEHFIELVAELVLSTFIREWMQNRVSSLMLWNYLFLLCTLLSVNSAWITFQVRSTLWWIRCTIYEQTV